MANRGRITLNGSPVPYDPMIDAMFKEAMQNSELARALDKLASRDQFIVVYHYKGAWTAHPSDHALDLYHAHMHVKTRPKEWKPQTKERSRLNVRIAPKRFELFMAMLWPIRFKISDWYLVILAIVSSICLFVFS